MTTTTKQPFVAFIIHYHCGGESESQIVKNDNLSSARQLSDVVKYLLFNWTLS